MADRLKTEKGFPKSEDIKQFSELISKYTALLSTISEKQCKGQDLEDFLIRGRKGAYEDLLQD
jgi:hypothetical protein